MPSAPDHPLINDSRDAPFLKLMVEGVAWCVPASVLMFWPGMFRWWMAPIYLVVTFWFLFPPFTLMLHCTSHRVLFRKEHAWMNEIIPWVLSPFFGQVPRTYAAHHIGMHHAEANLWEDDSSTLPYQRDSLADFGVYFGKFMTIGMINLTRYLWRKRRHKLARRALLGCLFFWGAVVLLGWFNWAATCTVLLVPMVLARLLMMSGNWAQHAFVDPGDPANSYRNSITCIEVGYNDKCFNDGYHIGHHLDAKMHWTEMRRDFDEHRAEYLAQGAVVFRGLDYLMIWALLMVGAYKTLARHMVQLGPTEVPEADRIALLHARLKPIPQPVTNAASVVGALS